MNYVGTLIPGGNVMISRLSFTVPVTLSSGQPLDSRACHSPARGHSNRSICFETIFEILELFLY